MKHYSKNMIFLFSFLMFVSFGIVSSRFAKAYDILISDAVYTNGTITETLTIHCGDILQLPPGGTITFVVRAVSDIMNYNELCIQSLPEGAVFQCVSGPGPTVSSVFTWSPPGPFSGSIVFVATPGFQDCILYFDWPLPVELSSFTYLINRNNVTLNWQTGSENNNSEFVIERSELINENNLNWIRAGSVKGNGTTSSASNYAFTDRNLSSGLYQYRIKQVDYSGNFEYYYLGMNVQIGEPVRFELFQNYPNPYNPATKINYELRVTNYVSVIVYDVLGNEITSLINKKQIAGNYEIEFDGSHLSSGIYFYSLLINGNTMDTKRMILLK